MKYCDLHVHSCFSDGTCTPAELTRLAGKAGLSAIALTDHNTIAGLPDFVAAAASAGLTPVCGCEFSTDFMGAEMHILGLFLHSSIWPEVTAYTEIRNRRKAQSNRDCAERLTAAGYAVSYDDILEKNPGASINRVHIAKALIEKGYVSSVKDAFDRLLQPEHGFFREPARLDALETIRRIKSWGATAVWAHPMISADATVIEAFAQEAAAAGLDGIETLYPLYSAEDAAFAASLVRRYNLLPSGGSDFHGENKPDISIGTGKGSLRVPTEYMTALSRRASHGQAFQNR